MLLHQKNIETLSLGRYIASQAGPRSVRSCTAHLRCRSTPAQFVALLMPSYAARDAVWCAIVAPLVKNKTGSSTRVCACWMHLVHSSS